jgi:hypothetical protein
MFRAVSRRLFSESYISLLVVFCTAFSVIMAETLSIRAGQVAFGHDFLFFIVPLTFLGIGIGGICASLIRTSERGHILQLVTFFYAVLTPAQFFIAAKGHTTSHTVLIMGAFFATSFAAYVCGGWAIVEILKRRKTQVSLVYFLDLVGATLGALAAAFALNLVGYEHAVLFVAVLAAMPALIIFLGSSPRLLILGMVSVGVFGMITLRIPISSLHIPCNAADTSSYFASNTFSELSVTKSSYVHLARIQELGNSPPTDNGLEVPYFITVDCGTFTTVAINTASYTDVAFLKQGLRSIPFALVQEQHASDSRILIPGSGAGIDVMRAELFHAGHIDAVEINPGIIAAAKLFSATSTYPYAQNNVTLSITDVRRFIQLNHQEYDLIFLARAGVYGTLAADVDSPNYGSTAEATRLLMDHLAPHGILAIASIQYTPLTDQSGRSVSIRGQHGTEFLTLIQREPFSHADLLALQVIANERGFIVSHAPFAEPASSNSTLTNLPNTDDQPYISVPVLSLGSSPYIILILTIMFTAVLGGVALIACVLGAMYTLRRWGVRDLVFIALLGIGAGATGFGFVFFELGMIQKIFFLMAESLYAVAVPLAAFLFFSAIGCLVSTYVFEKMLSRILLLATAGLWAYLLLLSLYDNAVFHALLPYSLSWRILYVGFLLALPAFIIGMFFPIGMRVAGLFDQRLIAWMWLVDGLFSVIGGFAAKTSFHLWGLHTTYPVTAAAYTLAAFSLVGCVFTLRRKSYSFTHA